MNAWRIARQPIISLFILFHILTMVLWVTPPFPMYWSILPPFRQYICVIGFWNTWTMFCHPKTWNLYLTANVTLADGTIITWDFPRMEKLDYWTRAQKEHYRKWAHEYINEEEYKFAWPEACRFIARNLPEGTARPVSTQLVRHWTWIQPPPGAGQPQPKGEYEYAFYTYNYEPEDLK
jgi:hypothetical protein